ncbi:hypothetical protein [Streptomyces sp. NPDC001530]|uniref:hypothetical protein n=1 Tax=Streptomyces sp. NPDC001530 TaxID=3364582 RepID=UPI0036AED914
MTLPSDWSTTRSTACLLDHLVHVPCGWRSAHAYALPSDLVGARDVIDGHECVDPLAAAVAELGALPMPTGGAS